MGTKREDKKEGEMKKREERGGVYERAAFCGQRN